MGFGAGCTSPPSGAFWGWPPFILRPAAFQSVRWPSWPPFFGFNPDPNLLFPVSHGGTPDPGISFYRFLILSPSSGERPAPRVYGRCWPASTFGCALLTRIDLPLVGACDLFAFGNYKKLENRWNKNWTAFLWIFAVFLLGAVLFGYFWGWMYMSNTYGFILRNARWTVIASGFLLLALLGVAYVFLQAGYRPFPIRSNGPPLPRQGKGSGGYLFCIAEFLRLLHSSGITAPDSGQPFAIRLEQPELGPPGLVPDPPGAHAFHPGLVSDPQKRKPGPLGVFFIPRRIDRYPIYL